jgi:hypothetical protein
VAGGDDAALAENWRTILLVDAAIGWAAVLGGAVLYVADVIPLLGALLFGMGAVYVVFGLRRARRWRRVRADHGLGRKTDAEP